jgi:prepilin-type N-terminal cleavage/methylation domain-containing protein
MRTMIRNRQGLSLIELLVAMVLLGIMITSVAGLTFEAGRRSIVASAENYRQAAMIREVNRLTAMPYSSISVGTACRYVTTTAMPHQICVTAAKLSNYSKTMTVIVRPAVRGVSPDTLVLIRANAPIINPLSL